MAPVTDAVRFHIDRLPAHAELEVETHTATTFRVRALLRSSDNQRVRATGPWRFYEAGPDGVELEWAALWR